MYELVFVGIDEELDTGLDMSFKACTFYLVICMGESFQDYS